MSRTGKGNQTQRNNNCFPDRGNYYSRTQKSHQDNSNMRKIIRTTHPHQHDHGNTRDYKNEFTSKMTTIEQKPPAKLGIHIK